MPELFIPGVEQSRRAALEAAIYASFGPGTYRVHINADVTPWQVSVLYWKANKALSGPITPDQAADSDCQRVLARELCRAAARAGLLENR